MCAVRIRNDTGNRQGRPIPILQVQPADSKGHGCDGRNVPMAKLDLLVRQALSERIFTPERVRKMIDKLRASVKKSQSGTSEKMKKLRAELEQSRLASERLFEVVEKGLLPMNDILSKRAHVLQAQRQALLAEIAGIQRHDQMPSRLLSSLNVQAFCKALKGKMLDAQSGFGKQYLRLLVDEIEVWELRS